MNRARELADRYWLLCLDAQGLEVNSREYVLLLHTLAEIRRNIDSICPHQWVAKTINHYVCSECGLDKP